MMVVCCQLHTIHLKSTEDQGQICNHRATHLQYNRAPILRWKLINCSCGTSMVGNCIVHDDVMKNHSEIQTRGLEPFQATQTVALFLRNHRNPTGEHLLTRSGTRPSE